MIPIGISNTLFANKYWERNEIVIETYCDKEFKKDPS